MSISRGIANFYFYPVNKNQEYWLQFDGRSSSSDKQQTSRINKILSALQYDSGNPDIISAHSQLLDRGTRDQFFWVPDVNAAYRKALENFYQVARFRPVSPWVWTNIALIKAKLKEYDVEFEQSLANANRLGPWEPLVNIRIADIGLAKWDFLSESARQVVLDGIRRGLKSSHPGILQIARSHRRIRFLCEQFEKEIASHKECQLVK